jgi:hypothetical protein
MSIFALSSCDFLNFADSSKVKPNQNQTTSQISTPEEEEEETIDTEETTPEVPDPIESDDLKPTNTPLNLDEWNNFTFHDGREPEYNEYWTFYHGDSKNPGGSLWENPKYEYSGPEFIKKCYIISPLFIPNIKIECRFKFWFSTHTSSSYKPTKNEPQFYLETYNNDSERLSSEAITIQESDVPKNNSPLTKTVYFRQSDATFFILRWNNYIAKGSNSGYSAILCDVGLKGWPYN